jgi:hypothetical protein
VEGECREKNQKKDTCVPLPTTLTVTEQDAKPIKAQSARKGTPERP